VTDARFQSYDSRQVQVARFIPIGQRVRLHVLVAARAGAPLSQRQQLVLDAGGKIEQTCSEGTQQPLVPRRGKQLAAKASHIDRLMAH
jgi:hypothetical protein